MFMKTTEKLNSQETIKTKVISTNILRAKSVRPQKSMVRIQSLKPKRLQIATKVNVKKSLNE